MPTEYEDEMAVLVAEVVKWEKEFRCFILHRKLMTYSLYSRYGELQRDTEFASTEEEDRELQAFIHILLTDSTVDLPQARVIDVGTIEGKAWACVEQNAAWGAGIYGCDPRLVLEVLRFAGQRK